jgi:hypothetical protein
MKEKQQKKPLNWKQKILRDLAHVENLLPEPDFIQDDWPEWARQMGIEIMRAIIPGVGSTILEDPSAHEVGRFVDAKEAAIIYAETVELTEKELEALEKLLVKKWGEKAEEKFMELLELGMNTGAFVQGPWESAGEKVTASCNRH